MRRLDKIFKTMAGFIGSREAEQCRSHHQKMEKKYFSFPNIALYLRKLHYNSDDARMVEDMATNNVTEKIEILDVRQLMELEEEREVESAAGQVEEARAEDND
jgi:hypothetical protein